MDILNIILSIILGLGALTPVVIALVRYIKLAIQEKNFVDIMDIVLDLMPEAEEQFDTGAQKKKYVMDNIKSVSDILGYKVNLNDISKMIDALVSLSKKINK